MPQLKLPIFSPGITLINANLGFTQNENTLTYFYGHLPVFTHDVNDRQSFRMITSQFYVNGSVIQAEICRAFGVSPISVKQCVKLYRQKGVMGFFEPPRRRGAAILTPDVLREVQELLDEGLEISEIASRMGLLADTLRKAIRAGRLHKPLKKEQNLPSISTASNKSERSVSDAASPIGMGAIDIFGRLLTSIFRQEALTPVFQHCYDVPNGGLLLALPALLAVGLLSHTEKHFRLPPGFYRLDTVFLFMAFMALARLKFIEALRYCPPGEWGKLLGVDRAPEVKTLREKVGILVNEGETQAWAGELCQDWMEAEPDSAGVFYVDGHVRVYSGGCIRYLWKTLIPLFLAAGKHFSRSIKTGSCGHCLYWASPSNVAYYRFSINVGCTL